MSVSISENDNSSSLENHAQLHDTKIKICTHLYVKVSE